MAHGPRQPDPRSRRRATRALARAAVLFVTVALVVSGAAPFAAGVAADATAQTENPVQQVDQPGDGPEDEAWAEPPAVDGADDDAVDDETRENVSDAVNETVASLQRQGVTINESQRIAAVNGSLAAASQYQDASVTQVQNATAGAVEGTFLQSQNVSVTQIQNATAGSAAGALSQHQNVSAAQAQHAAYGAAHGAVAQSQNVSVEQVQYVAAGAAAGAAHEAGKQNASHPGAVREAAQGAAFGALSQHQNVSVEQSQQADDGAATQRQSVTVEQRQYAAAGAAEGALSQHQNASVKQIQVAAIGAATGALSQQQGAAVEQRQEVSVTQIQAAARGACKGSLTQVQEVSVTQIQEAATGAAKGAITQSQEASVTQIQSAATGAAQGVLTQKQVVNVAQIQSAATGAAQGAVQSAVQHQVVNVEQIQSAAYGAGQGSIVQIQQVNIVQVQVIAQGAASGSLSQHQEASVTQIQSAAQGASEGTLSLTQRQEVSIEQIQTVTQQAAENTVATAIEINVDNSVTVYEYAKGSASDPDDDDDELRSLFASEEDGTVFLANPNDVAVTVSITSEDGELQTQTLSAGESTTLEFDRGTYTLTAETADGEDIEIAGRDEITVSIGEELQDLDVDVDDGLLTVQNPNDVSVTVDLYQAGDFLYSVGVVANSESTQQLAPGTYTLTAETAGEEPVEVNDESEHQVTVQPQEIALDASAENGTLTVENPSDVDVTATVAPDDGEETTFDVPAGETASEQFEPGNYTLTGDAEDDVDVLFDGQSTFEFEVGADEPEPDALDLNVTIDGQNVTLENPSESDVTVSTAEGSTEDREIGVPANETVTESFAPGEYTLTGDSEEDREVLLNGESELSMNVAEEPVQPTATLNVSDQTGNGTVLDVENASATVPFALTVTYDGEESSSVEYEANETVEDVAIDLEPALENDTQVTVSVVGAENETELANETVQYDVEGGEPVAPTADLTVEDQAGNGSSLLVANASASVDFVVEAEANDTSAESQIFDANESVENLSLDLEPPLENDSEVTVTLSEADAEAGDDGELANETVAYDVTEEEAPTANLTVQDQEGNGSSLLVANASASVDYVVEAEADETTGESDVLDANESVENLTVDLEPPLENDTAVNVSVSGADAEAGDDGELANDTVQYTVTDETEAPTATVNVTDQTTNGSVVLVESANLSEGGFLAVHADSTNDTDDVLGNSSFLESGEQEDLVVALDEPLTEDASVNVTAHADTGENETFEYVTSAGAEDAPYLDADGEPVSNETNLTVEPDVEPGIEYVNCTTANVTGEFTELTVNQSFYTEEGNETITHVFGPEDVPTDQPVDGETVVTVGEANETTVTDDGTLVVQIADQGTFGDEFDSFVANVTAENDTATLSESQPEIDECRDDVRPDAPTVGVESIAVQDDETAQVTLTYENPNDAPLVPAESTFTNGTVDDEAPQSLEPGENTAAVQWTPETADENVVWTVNLSNFGHENATATGPTAAEVEGLLEPPADEPDDADDGAGATDEADGDDAGPLDGAVPPADGDDEPAPENDTENETTDGDGVDDGDEAGDGDEVGDETDGDEGADGDGIAADDGDETTDGDGLAGDEAGDEAGNGDEAGDGDATTDGDETGDGDVTADGTDENGDGGDDGGAAPLNATG